MSNYQNTKATIAANVYTNHNNEVTAEMVKTGINAVVDTLIAGGFIYKGVAHPGDAAVSPDANVFYIASEAGTYTNKGGLVVADGEVCILKYNGSWSKEVTGAATAAEVTALGHEVGGILIGQGIEKISVVCTGNYSTRFDSATIPAGSILLSMGATIPRLLFYYDNSNYEDVYANALPHTFSHDIIKIRDLNVAGTADLVFARGEGYKYAGLAVLTPTPTNPGTPSERVYYIASEVGTYSNFGNLKITDGEAAFFKWDGAWIKEVPAPEIQKLLTGQNNSASAGVSITGGQGNTYNTGAYADIDLKAGTYSMTYTTTILGTSTTLYVMYVGTSSYVSVGTLGSITEVTLANDVKRIGVWAVAAQSLSTGTCVFTFTDKNIVLPLGARVDNLEEAANNLQPALSLCGLQGEVLEKASASNEIVKITNWPRYIKSSGIYSVEAEITSFATIALGVGYGEMRARYIKVDATNLYFCHYTPEAVDKTVAHGLTIGTFIKVVCIIDGLTTKAIISTMDGVFNDSYTLSDSDAHRENYGSPSLYLSSGTSLTNIKFNANCEQFQRPVWVFGDSMASEFEDRWPYYTRYVWGFKYFLCALAGGNSAGLFTDLEAALQHGTPKYLVWMLGANDLLNNNAPSYKSYVEKVEAICESKGIELILQKFPSWNIADTTSVDAWMVALGHRYVDFNRAVGSDSSGNWYPGYLAGDDRHPTALGAKAEASQMCVDVPEIMQEN